MKWRRGQGGGGVEDLRGSGSRGRVPMGGKVGGGLGGLGLVGVIIFVLVSVLGGGGGGGFSLDPGGLDAFPQAPAATGPGIDASAPDPEADLVQFVSFVVADIQDSWADAFANADPPRQYDLTAVRLFRGGVDTGCGQAASATGPFYCPADQRIYLDLAFFRELSDRFGAPGDFAQAYVIAHEFGHHVQNLLGTLPEVSRLQQERPDQANELSVRLELQADCYAGIWARSAYDDALLEEGDLEEGLAAAAAVGDDRLQTQATGTYDRESFTHGSSEQRQRWFLVGFQDGRVDACNTFSPETV
jgi:predicted metalloprotease